VEGKLEELDELDGNEDVDLPWGHLEAGFQQVAENVENVKFEALFELLAPLSPLARGRTVLAGHYILDLGILGIVPVIVKEEEVIVFHFLIFDLYLSLT
jgi:hypothetical protein